LIGDSVESGIIAIIQVGCVRVVQSFERRGGRNVKGTVIAVVVMIRRPGETTRGINKTRT
jgi:hypothetical protein